MVVSEAVAVRTLLVPSSAHLGCPSVHALLGEVWAK